MFRLLSYVHCDVAYYSPAFIASARSDAITDVARAQIARQRIKPSYPGPPLTSTRKTYGEVKESVKQDNIHEPPW
jgi:hypothetical protein